MNINLRAMVYETVYGSVHACHCTLFAICSKTQVIFTPYGILFSCVPMSITITFFSKIRLSYQGFLGIMVGKRWKHWMQWGYGFLILPRYKIQLFTKLFGTVIFDNKKQFGIAENTILLFPMIYFLVHFFCPMRPG